MSKATPTLCVMGNFQDPNKVMHAAEKIRESGFQAWDIYCPYPLHGLDKAMGVKRSPLTKMILGGALFGLTNAIFLQMWTGAFDYKLNIGGKPLFAFQFAVPVMFELTVLFSALTAVFGMFGPLCGLPKWWSPWQRDKGFRQAVDDTFVVCLESGDTRFSVDGAKKILQELGANDVRVVEADVR